MQFSCVRYLKHKLKASARRQEDPFKRAACVVKINFIGRKKKPVSIYIVLAFENAPNENKYINR